MRNILVKKNNGQEVMVCDVLYVPFIASNLISLDQLFDKDYKMKFEEREVKVFDEMCKLILKEPLSINKKFKIMINMLDHQCLASTMFGDQNWIWYQRFGHLNF